jgi:hypothetical protein
MTIRLELTGKPTGKGRPRFGQGGRVFTPNATKLAEIAVLALAGVARADGAALVDPAAGSEAA